MIFRDRHDAGRQLGALLEARFGGRDDVLVLALPRGGVPVGYQVAEALGAPLEVFLVRKLGVPGHEELAFGAIATGGTEVLNDDIVEGLGIPEEAIERISAREQNELLRRERIYRGDRSPPTVTQKTVLVVDDGLATGASMRAAVEALRQQGPSAIVVAVPVAAAPTCDEMRALADEVVCAATPEGFFGVGMWYDDFRQTSDAEVQELLLANREHRAGRRAA